VTEGFKKQQSFFAAMLFQGLAMEAIQGIKVQP
jgi:hypothetical protein